MQNTIAWDGSAPLYPTNFVWCANLWTSETCCSLSPPLVSVAQRHQNSRRVLLCSSTCCCRPLRQCVTVALFNESADKFQTGPKTWTTHLGPFVSTRRKKSSLCFYVIFQNTAKQGKLPLISFKFWAGVIRDSRCSWTGSVLNCIRYKAELFAVTVRCFERCHTKGVSSFFFKSVLIAVLL